MAALRREPQAVAVAAGENWCTRHQFAAMVREGAVDIVQPSVTKVGGLSEFLAVMRLAERSGLAIMPHSPYFGPGWFATLHLVALAEQAPLVEWLWVEPEAMPCRETPSPVAGSVAIPDGPGLGFDLDPDVLRTYGRRAALLA
jgi:L-alanine-DL-glutamate epimerase-like enolase superfamily enzyme